MNIGFAITALLAMWLLPASASLAQGVCDAPARLSQTQVHDLLSVIEDNMSPSVDQVFAFNALQCSDQPIIRDLALRAGAASHSPSVHSDTLFWALAHMSIVTVELDGSEGLTSQHYAYLEHNRFNSDNVTYVDHTKTCLSLGQKDTCDPEMLLAVNGREVAMKSTWKGHDSDAAFEAVFTYRGGEYLHGSVEMQVGTDALNFPAIIRLF